ncbi:YccF domain-containing protein [Desulfobaculum sp.]
MIRMLLNILWLVLGGLPMAIGWWLSGVVMIVTIIGIPWARSCFVIGTFALWPFGREVADRRDVTGREDIGTGPLGMLGNVVWFILAGIWLAIGHLVAALANFITIIGIPFGFQHLKLAVISLAPIGKTVVVREV